MTEIRTCAFSTRARKPRNTGSRRIFRIGAVLMFCVTTGTASLAQTVNTLVNFDGSSGFYPQLMSIVQGTDGDFYGTTSLGGTNNVGTVFKVTANGELITLYSFDNTHGADPWAGLVQGRDGDFYGSTAQGGVNGYGTVFRISSAGKFTTLYSF